MELVEMPPWIDGPRELLQHAVDHVSLRGDFDRRIAMVSVDNAVELMIKTYLGLSERARGTKGPGRKELETASESFPGLLDLLQTYAADKLSGVSLDDIEWYHRLRNQLYHSGNGITVEASKVDTYLQLSIQLFENLFGVQPALNQTSGTRSHTGHFLEVWNAFDQGLRKRLPPKDGPSYSWKREFLSKVSGRAVPLYDEVAQFRNLLVHGLDSPDAKAIEEQIENLRELGKQLKIRLPS